MKKKRIIVNFAVFVVLLVACNIGLRQVYFVFAAPQDLYYPPQEAFDAHQGPYDVTVFGDSHALVSIKSQLMGNVANLSQLGEGYVMRYYRIRYNVHEHPGKIKTLLLPLDLHSFSPAWGEHFGLSGSSHYVNYLDYLWQSGLSRHALENVVHYYLFPYANCLQDPNLWPEETPEEGRENVQQRLERKLSDMDVTQKQVDRALRAHFGQEGQWRSDKTLRYFNRLKALCQEEDIRVVFVRFPVSEQYFEAASKVVPVEQVDQFQQGLVDDWPGAVLLDYRDVYFGRDDLFSDLNHLNAEGTKMFSGRLRDDLIRLGALSSAVQPSTETVPE